MRKRLYWITFISFAAFFLFTSIIANLLGLVQIDLSWKSIIYIAISIVFIILISYYLSYRVLKRIINPFNKYTNYIAKKILNEPIKQAERENQEEVNKLLQRYGHNFDEIEKGITKLREVSKSRREFSANVSHELKSPLTSINGYAEMISTGITSPEESKEFAKRIFFEGNRLLELIDDTIELSKIDNNHIKADTLKLFDVGEIIKDIVDRVQIQLEEKNMTINYEYKKVKFYGNQNLIFDLVNNLISNAIKYSSEHNPKLNIYIHENSDDIVMIFKDNGIGISEKDQERIFERFYVADKSRGDKAGTGLGLSLVKNIVEFHNGEINLDSELDKGSTFKIKLPLIREKMNLD